MACLQHSVEGYFIPSPSLGTSRDTRASTVASDEREAFQARGESPALWAPVPLEALPPSARLTLLRLKKLRLAAASMAVYFIVVMIVERNAEYLGSAAGPVEHTRSDTLGGKGGRVGTAIQHRNTTTC